MGTLAPHRFCSGRLLGVAAVVAVWGAIPATVPAQPPAVAVFTDGVEVKGVVADLADVAKARIGKRRLFDPASPVRALVTEVVPVDGPTAFVEFDDGDVLPGRVIAHRPERFEWQDLPTIAEPTNHPRSFPATLAIAVDEDIAQGGGWGQLPKTEKVPPVLVRRDRVRRITWQGDVGRRHPPRTLVLTDGGVVAFRSLRWADDGVVVLLEDGSTERHEFSAIAALNLQPRPDPWNAWFESVDDGPGLVTIETQSGLRATTPLSRLRNRGAWIMIQPTWALMPIMPHLRGITRLVATVATEPPLSRLEPSAVVQRSMLGHSWTWQRDRNVQHGPLEPHGPPAGWGIGVQARTEVSFPLCAGVTGFRGRVGLDRAVGDGGCVQASIHAGSAKAPALWQSGVLVGSGTCADCGTVAIGGSDAGSKQIVLVADDAHRDRPPNADPYDIRDVVDWIDPRLVLDPATVAAQAAARLPFVVPAWSGWTQVIDAGTTVRLVTAIDTALSNENAGWAAATVADGGSLRLTRQWPTLRPQDANLLIAASAIGNDKPVIDVHVGGRRWQLPLAVRSPNVPLAPFVLSIPADREGPLMVEIVVPAKAVVQWHALGLTGPLDTDWFPLQPQAMESSAGSTFRIRDDGSILVTSPPSPTDDYTIRLRSPGRVIRAVRIDALTDPALMAPAKEQAKGPGRSKTGSFDMSKLVLESVIDGTRQPLAPIFAGVRPLANAAASPLNALDGAGTWHGSAGKACSAALRLPAAEQGPNEIVVRMEFRDAKSPQSLGCFRILGSDDPAARIPIAAVTHLVTEPDPAGGPARQTILATTSSDGGTP